MSSAISLLAVFVACFLQIPHSSCKTSDELTPDIFNAVLPLDVTYCTELAIYNAELVMKGWCYKRSRDITDEAIQHARLFGFCLISPLVTHFIASYKLLQKLKFKEMVDLIICPSDIPIDHRLLELRDLYDISNIVALSNQELDDGDNLNKIFAPRANSIIFQCRDEFRLKVQKAILDAECTDNPPKAAIGPVTQFHDCFVTRFLLEFENLVGENLIDRNVFRNILNWACADKVKAAQSRILFLHARSLVHARVAVHQGEKRAVVFHQGFYDTMYATARSVIMQSGGIVLNQTPPNEQVHKMVNAFNDYCIPLDEGSESSSKDNEAAIKRVLCKGETGDKAHVDLFDFYHNCVMGLMIGWLQVSKDALINDPYNLYDALKPKFSKNCDGEGSLSKTQIQALLSAPKQPPTAPADITRAVMVKGYQCSLKPNEQGQPEPSERIRVTAWKVLCAAETSLDLSVDHVDAFAYYSCVVNRLTKDYLLTRDEMKQKMDIDRVMHAECAKAQAAKGDAQKNPLDPLQTIKTMQTPSKSSGKTKPNVLKMKPQKDNIDAQVSQATLDQAAAGKSEQQKKIEGWWDKGSIRRSIKKFFKKFTGLFSSSDKKDKKKT